MLVLTRKLGESIMIGDEIEIRIVDIRGDKIRVGVTAPHRYPVDRMEIYRKKKDSFECSTKPT